MAGRKGGYRGAYYGVREGCPFSKRRREERRVCVGSWPAPPEVLVQLVGRILIVVESGNFQPMRAAATGTDSPVITACA